MNTLNIIYIQFLAYRVIELKFLKKFTAPKIVSRKIKEENEKRRKSNNHCCKTNKSFPLLRI